MNSESVREQAPAPSRAGRGDRREPIFWDNVPFCRGKSLRVGIFSVRAKSAEANFEIDLNHQEAPIVAGSADAVALIEVAGVRIFPK